MDIVSELPQKTVTDYVFHFVGGTAFTVTVGPDDTVSEGDQTHVITHYDGVGRDRKMLERIVVEKRNLLYASESRREVTIWAAGQSPMELAMAQIAQQATKTYPSRKPTSTTFPTNPR